MYPTKVSVGAEKFNVQTVLAFGTNQGTGNLAGSFEMALFSVNENRDRFIMGSALNVAVTWNARFLDDFTFTLEECRIQHGDVEIAVVKNGCFSGLLNASPMALENPHARGFQYQIFKGSDEESTSQSLTCTISVCKNYCKIPKFSSECPQDDVFKYELP
jgi:hypothetical protein